MKSFKGAALAAVAIALAATAQAGAAGPTTVSAVYTVGGLTVPGVNTGLVLQPGQVVTVTATGGVCPFGDSYCPGPDGNPAVDTTGTTFGGFPLPGAPAWGLVGRVGTGQWVQIGQGPTTLSGTGELAFAVNDDLLWDNARSFTVTVSYACWPGWGYGDKNHTHCGPPGLISKVQTEATETGNLNGDRNAKGHENGPGRPAPASRAEESQGHGKPDKGSG